ncbi:hypothetical protein I4F81_010414 [Pyropia yezoensis]|uniref:Uncharacterized protein n=1 Tax=Pyropia yezoensis TaxID=2788 RepID=A0ACC3CCL4_PYRYE|nr:hypothetical protein I4F81_010414 [Neopyropia yezoensis]
MDTEAFLASLPGEGNYGTRYANSLECLQIDLHGRMRRRQMTRSQLLSEARSTLPQAVPSPKQIGDWMLAENEASAEMRAFASRVGIKSSRKGLRNYLRNALQARDIRQVDPAFTAKPALWVRHSALVVSLDAVRALILHNKMFLFNPTHAAVRAAVPAIRASILSDGGVVDDVTNRAELLEAAVEDTEDLAAIHLDTLRNRLLMIETALSVVSLTFTVGSVVAGVLGMNLPIAAFESPNSHWYFLAVSLSILLFVVGASWATLNFLKRRGLYTTR